MSRISIIKVRNDDVFSAVKEAIDLLGGIGRFVKPGNRVLIKVNMFIDGRYTSGYITDPRVAIAVARLAREAGGDVTIGERTKNIHRDFEDFPEVHDYARVVSFDNVPHTHMVPMGAMHLRAPVPIPDIVNDCDVFINIPGLRTHILSGVSNGMKNLMGLLPGGSTGHVHMYGLRGSIVDLNFHRPSDIVITDAIYSLQGNFPGTGEAVRTGLVMASDNVVASDAVAAKMAGFEPWDLDYLVEANRRGLGPVDLSQVEFFGEKLDAVVSLPCLEQTPAGYEPYRDKVKVLDENACEACRRALSGGLKEASLSPEFENVKDLTVIVGPFGREPEIRDAEVQAGAQAKKAQTGNGRTENVRTGNIVLYGNCTYRYRHLGNHVQGCPPLLGQACTAVLGSIRRPVRVSFCSIAWRDEKIETIVPWISDLGYDGIEIWGNHLSAYMSDHGELDSLKDMLDKHGLKVPMISPYFNLVGGEEDKKASIEEARRFIGYAKALGGPFVRVFTGPVGPAGATQAQWDQAVDALRKITAGGLSEGISFALETHQNNLMDTTDSTLRLIRRAGAENLKVILDIHNLFAVGEDPAWALERLYPVVSHVHLKNRRFVDGKPEYGAYLGEGDMDYTDFFARLMAKGYRGFVSVEWFGGNQLDAARHELEWLKNVLAGEVPGQAGQGFN